LSSTTSAIDILIAKGPIAFCKNYLGLDSIDDYEDESGPDSPADAADSLARKALVDAHATRGELAEVSLSDDKSVADTFDAEGSIADTDSAVTVPFSDATGFDLAEVSLSDDRRVADSFGAEGSVADTDSAVTVAFSDATGFDLAEVSLSDDKRAADSFGASPTPLLDPAVVRDPRVLE